MKHPSVTITIYLAAAATFVLALLLQLTCLAAESGVDAWLDTNRTQVGSSVQLTIKAEGRLSGKPDISALKKDFDIIGSSSASSVNIVNNRISTTTQWIFDLVPRHAGTIRIPPLDIDGKKTPELLLEVNRQSTSDRQRHQDSRDIFIKTTCKPGSPFIQQQVICRVQLFSSREIAEGTMTAPEQPDALIRHLGKDIDYRKVINGRQYRIIERRYAIFPQKSGKLTISAPVFNGTVVVQKNLRSRDPFSSLMGRDPFFSHGLPGLGQATRKVRVAGTSVTLDVKPVPDTYTGAFWLPARYLALSQRWEPDGGTVQQGEPVTRTLTLTAGGLAAEQLPDLVPDSVEGFRVYPDNAELNSTEDRNGITGTKTRKIVFIPDKSGTLTIPPVTVTWWNTEKGRQETLTLPGKTISVTPAPTTEAAPGGAGQKSVNTTMNSAGSLQESKDSAGARESEGMSAGKEMEARTFSAGRVLYWQVLCAVIGILWLATLYLLWRTRKNGSFQSAKAARPQQGPALKHMPLDEREFTEKLRRACAQNDAAAAKKVLLEHGARIWPDDPPTGLEQLASRISNRKTAKQIKKLNAILYGNGGETWTCDEETGTLLADIRPQDRTIPHNKGQGLPPLYSK